MMRLLILLLLVGVACANVVQSGGRTRRLAKRGLKVRSTVCRNVRSAEPEAPVLEKNATQKLTFIVFRHGERTLAIKYPNDPYAFNASYWPDGDGQLTMAGKLRMYNLGLYLKERYANFITSDPREMKMQSSGLERCIESAELVAFAMYPPQDRWIWNANFTNWQPLPISSTIPNTDPMINPHAACKNGWAERDAIFQSDYVKNIDNENRDLYDFLTEHVGLPVNNIDDAKAVFDGLMVEKSVGYQLPNWTNPILLSRLEKLYDQTFYVEFMTRRAQMFRTGVFINEIQEKIRQKLTLEKKTIKKPTKFEWDPDDFEHKKLYLYSSHDSFISALLVALGNFDFHYPPFAASVLFEIYQNDLDHLVEGETNRGALEKIALDNTFIKFFYLKHTETKQAKQLTLPNCKHKEYCSFREFFHYTQDLILTKADWYKKCAE